jgi:uncharacterized protein (DUF2062 family)
MIHLTRALIRRWLGVLLHIDDTPERTAAAFALGVFFGFSPFLGLHTLLGIAFAFLLSLNRVAVLLGVYSNLPWVVAPYYAFVTVAGARITGDKMPADFKSQFGALFDHSVFNFEFWDRLITLLKPLLWPYAVGSTVAAIILAALAYPVALAFVTSRRRIHDIMIHRRQ